MDSARGVGGSSVGERREGMVEIFSAGLVGVVRPGRLGRFDGEIPRYKPEESPLTVATETGEERSH